MTGAELPKEVRGELRSLSSQNADTVARHLVMATQLLDSDPQLAYAHASAAQRLAGRLGVVREAFGISAYAAGHFAEALAELRAARRITGSYEFLPMMADCERGLGRPERALALATSVEAARLDRASSVELRIVASGARRDLGQADAAVLALQGPDLTPRTPAPWTSRLQYAYADALLHAGRSDEAEEWFATAQENDPDGETDAGARLAELQGLTFLDLEEEDEGAEAGVLGAPPAAEQRGGAENGASDAADGSAAGAPSEGRLFTDDAPPPAPRSASRATDAVFTAAESDPTSPVDAPENGQD